MFWTFLLGAFFVGIEKSGYKFVGKKLEWRPDGRGQQLAVLVEAGHIFSSELSPQVAFEQVLDFLKRRHGVIRGAVTLLDPKTQEIRVDVSTGLSDAGRFARYRLGEGITGRVVETGKPIVVPKVSREPMFLNRAGKRDLKKQEITYMCVPIVVKSKPVGALGVDLKFKPERDYDSELKCFGLVAAMMAQAIKAEHLVDDERRRLMDENTHLLEELKERYDFSNIIGTAGPMRQVYEQIAQVAHTNTTVLIRGESGTGKELIAHAIHYNSPRAQKPFIKVNCAALPETLIESELFGYEKGAFTGAHALKKGRFELAEGGTLFLDEIGDMNMTTQVQTPSRPAGKRIRAARRHTNHSRECPPDCGNQQRSGKGHGRRKVPRGPVLPAERIRDLCSAAARPEIGSPSACPIISCRSTLENTRRTFAAFRRPRSTC